MKQIETSTLSSQDISAALLAHTYTADAERSVLVRLFADGVAGDGDYTAHVTIQRLGAGSAHQVVPATPAPVASGVTSIALTTIAIPVKTADVLKVYLLGLAADDSVSVISEIWEDNAVLDTVWTGAKAGYLDASISSRSTLTAQAVWDALASALTTAGSIGKLLVDRLDAAISTRLAALSYTEPPSAENVRDAILSDGQRYAGANIDAAVSSRLAALSYTEPPSAENVRDAILSDGQRYAGANIDAAVSSRLAALSYAAPPATGDIADAVWDESLSGHSAAGTAGEAVSRLDAAVSTRSAPGDQMDLVGALNETAIAAITSGLEATLASLMGAGWTAESLKAIYDQVLTRLASADYDVSPTANDIADAVWDEALGDHKIADSAGAVLSSAGGAADPLLNAVPGTYANGTAGAALGRISTSQIVTVSPVSSTGDVETIRGDDYKTSDGRALEWTNAGAAWVDLTGATVKIVISGVAEFTGEVVSADTIRLQLSAAQSTTITAGGHPYQIIATQSDGDVVTLLEGTWRSKAKVRA